MEYTDCISLAALTEEIQIANGLELQDKEDFARKVRKKYAFLFNHVIMRSKLDYRFKGKDMIPKRDKYIVKGLLTRALPSTERQENDRLIVKWFNNKLRKDDYETILQLGFQIENLIGDELYYEDEDMDAVTKDEWISAIHGSINFNLAVNVSLSTQLLYDLNTELKVLDHRIPFGDMIKQYTHGARVYQWRGLSSIPNPSVSIEQNLKGCFSLNDYSEFLYAVIEYIRRDACRKSIEFIKAYAELKKFSGFQSADQFLSKDSLASEYTAFFQNIYDFLYERPEVTKSIEEEIKTDGLLSFFQMRDRNSGAKRKQR